MKSKFHQILNSITSILILVLMSIPLAEIIGQIHPLPVKIIESYKTEIENLTNDSLVKILYLEDSNIKIVLVLKEISRRNLKEPSKIFDEFISVKSKQNKFGQIFLINTAKIEKIRSTTKNQIELIQKLDQVLSEIKGDKKFIRAIAIELRNINQNESKEVLQKHVNKDSSIEENLFKLETKEMSNLNIVSFCINSVEQKLSSSKNINFPYFLAEKSLLRYRLNSKAALKIIRNKLLNPSWKIKKDSKNHKIYIQFLKFIEFRFSNPDSSTNPLMNPKVKELVSKIN